MVNKAIETENVDLFRRIVKGRETLPAGFFYYALSSKNLEFVQCIAPFLGETKDHKLYLAFRKETVELADYIARVIEEREIKLTASPIYFARRPEMVRFSANKKFLEMWLLSYTDSCHYKEFIKIFLEDGLPKGVTFGKRDRKRILLNAAEYGAEAVRLLMNSPFDYKYWKDGEEDFLDDVCRSHYFDVAKYLLDTGLFTLDESRLSRLHSFCDKEIIQFISALTISKT
jgi:hypothetical protein